MQSETNEFELYINYTSCGQNNLKSTEDGSSCGQHYLISAEGDTSCEHYIISAKGSTFCGQNNFGLCLGFVESGNSDGHNYFELCYDKETWSVQQPSQVSHSFQALHSLYDQNFAQVTTY